MGRRRGLFVGICLLLVYLSCVCVYGASKGSLDVTFLSVGQGDSVFVRTPSGKTILIDGGGRSSHDSVGTKIVEPFLRRQGVNKIDMVVLTHPHDDHVNGLVPVLRDFRVGSVLDSGIPHGSKSYGHFLKLIKTRKIKYRRAVRGQTIDLGDGVTARVLNPPAQRLDGTSDDVNNNSVVLRLKYGRSSVLLMGDAGVEAEEDMLRSGLGTRSDVLKLGHHGSDTATGEEWLDAVRPQAVVISVGRGNSFGHPSKKILRRLTQRRVKVYRTDRHGAVTVEFGKSKFKVRRSHRY